MVQHKLIIRYTNPTKYNWEKNGSDQRWYCYTTVYNQELTLYVFNQHNLNKEQYSEIFHINVDIGDAILIPCPNVRHSKINGKHVWWY